MNGVLPVRTEERDGAQNQNHILVGPQLRIERFDEIFMLLVNISFGAELEDVGFDVRRVHRVGNFPKSVIRIVLHDAPQNHHFGAAALGMGK